VSTKSSQDPRDASWAASGRGTGALAGRSTRSLDGIVSARIHLTRDSGFVDIVRRYDVLINGEALGRIKNGGVFECDIPPGKNSVQLRVDWCGSNTVEFEAAEGEVVHLECGSNLRGWKFWRMQKIMRESPNGWIWLKTRSNAI